MRSRAAVKSNIPVQLLRRLFLGLHYLRRSFFVLALLLISSSSVIFAQQTSAGSAANHVAEPAGSKITLDVSETFFSFFAGLNSCGYDQELASSDPVRDQIRADVIRAVAASDDAQFQRKQLCAFVHDHPAPEPSHNISQY